MTKLQIAADIANRKELIKIGNLVSDIVDVFEIGTPVILQEGLETVREVKNAFPEMNVLADMKIMDAGAFLCQEACAAGADTVTVLAVADDETIREVVEVAHRYNRKVFADLICINDIGSRAKELVELGVDYVGVHVGLDQQKKGRTPLYDLEQLVQAIQAEKTAVAGGVSLVSLPEYLKFHPGFVVIGSALYNAPDIRTAASEMKRMIREDRS